jgi:hypothetical protein
MMNHPAPEWARLSAHRLRFWPHSGQVNFVLLAFGSRMKLHFGRWSLYEQGKVHHVGPFPELEEQMCSFVPGESEGSPDRMDALVWALTELCIDPQPVEYIPKRFVPVYPRER